MRQVDKVDWRKIGWVARRREGGRQTYQAMMRHRSRTARAAQVGACKMIIRQIHETRGAHVGAQEGTCVDGALRVLDELREGEGCTRFGQGIWRRGGG